MARRDEVGGGGAVMETPPLLLFFFYSSMWSHDQAGGLPLPLLTAAWETLGVTAKLHLQSHNNNNNNATAEDAIMVK